jgi:hypothetical protein
MAARQRRLGIVAAGLFLLPAGAARAVGLDHLQCYRITDPVKLKAVVDLDSPQLGIAQGCRVSRAKWFCVPAGKTVQEANVPILPVNGEQQSDDRVCYKVKCPKPFPPDQQVTDQFGSRVLERLVPSILCTPAHKGPPTTTTTTMPPCGIIGQEPEQTCGGACPAGERCAFEFGPGGNPDCRCYPDDVTLCGETAFPSCGGVCLDGRACQAVRALDGPSVLLRACFCVEPTSSCSAPPQCPGSGTCPVGQVCEVNLVGPSCGCTSP